MFGLGEKTQQVSSSKTFVWSGVDATGRRVKNQKMVAPSVPAVVAALKREGYLPTEVKETSGMNLNVNIGPEGVKFKWRAKAEFARRLYQMLRAGISTPRALATMAEDAKPQVATMCLDMAEKVSAGQSLASAMADHPRAFDEVFVAYVQSGEESGTLVDTLGRLSTLMAKRAAMAAKIKGVMAYPKMVGGTILVIVFGIIMFLVPQYTKIYDSFGAKLPAPTLALVWASHHMLPFTIKSVHLGMLPFFLPIPQPLHILSFVLYLLLGWWIFRARTRDNLEVGRVLDRIKFGMPVLGQMNHKSSLFRWASTLAGALSSGVPMTRALELAAAASGSPWQKLTAADFMKAVRSGRQISKAMEEQPKLYPPNLRTMVATGENTGETAEMLDSVALSLDEDVDGIVAGLSAKIEVALLLVLGVVVGGLLLVLYMPILQLATTASKGLGVGH